MTIANFIHLAIKGGWKKEEGIMGFKVFNNGDYFSITFKNLDSPTYSVNDILLDPEAWRAVCIERKWLNYRSRSIGGGQIIRDSSPAHREFMYHMIEYICDGGKAKTYLKTL